jgi:high-affinity iron transporter
MLPSFVIGLREGVEAALIVGIIAGFLRQEGRRDALRPMWTGVLAAIAICLAVGGLLELLDKELPQGRQEGLETVVFLLAVFQNADDPATAGFGALLGLAVAVAIGALIYRGGVRLNLARFFRVTGFVLVLVAAGLVASTLHSAHEAGWLNAGQGQALDLTWLVVPGSWTSALLTGMLGWQPLPTYAELLGYLVYLIPAAVYVLWPAGVPLTRRATATA